MVHLSGRKFFACLGDCEWNEEDYVAQCTLECREIATLPVTALDLGVNVGRGLRDAGKEDAQRDE